jgi:UDPglucose 6-dehydrogenase
MARIAVVGTGYVGLTTGACLAHLGHNVVCADVVESKVALLNGGDIPIVEAGLEGLVREGLSDGRLSFVVGAPDAVRGAEFVFLCLPTPQGADGAADLTILLAAAEEIASHLVTCAVVINKSTVPVGSAEIVSQTLGRSDVSVVSNPEFLREGTAVRDCLHPDRIVLGGNNVADVQRVATLYQKIDAPVVLTDTASAETIKYAANAFLAMKIAFVNTIANVCERVGADVTEVVAGVGHDRRIGFEFMKPGPGWGGSCFPKDANALIKIAADHGYDYTLLKGVVEANADQHDGVARKVARMVGGSLAGVTVGVWGLTFKAETDDLRSSPALAVIDRLRARGARVQAYDPTVLHNIDGIDVMVDAYDAARGARVLVILTEWPEFQGVDFDKVREIMASPTIVDARNLLSPAGMEDLGFAYDGIGRSGPLGKLRHPPTKPSGLRPNGGRSSLRPEGAIGPGPGFRSRNGRPGRRSTQPLGNVRALNATITTEKPMPGVPDRRTGLGAKRLLDLVLGIPLAMAALPLIAVFALGIAVSFRCWPFFSQWRTGKDGKPFRFLKIRTLPPNTPAYASKFTLEEDSLPWLARFLRKQHLDELPQLLLVPLGKMSLVGPRPKMPDDHEPIDPTFGYLRTTVPQGCTGLWQIGEHAHLRVCDSAEYDYAYLRHGGVRFDLWVLWRTALLLIGKNTPVSLQDESSSPRWVRGRGFYPVDELVSVVPTRQIGVLIPVAA